MVKNVQPDLVTGIMQRLASAVQAVARRTNPQARVEVAVNTDSFSPRPSVSLLCGTGLVALPVNVKHSYGFTGQRNGKVTVTIEDSGYNCVWTKTCETWTDERIAEAAEIVWAQFDLRQKAARAQAQAYAASRVNEEIAVRINSGWHASGLRIVADSNGFRLSGTLTENEAVAISALLDALRKG